MYLVQAQVVTDEQRRQVERLAAKECFVPGPGGSGMPPAPAAALRAILGDTLPGTWTNVRWVVLWPSAQIGQHQDPPIAAVRYHLPVQINPDCWSFHGGHWQQLSRGRWYQIDPTIAHGAVNWGATQRVHLMVDIEP